jgi:hypothetical protein
MKRLFLPLVFGCILLVGDGVQRLDWLAERAFGWTLWGTKIYATSPPTDSATSGTPMKDESIPIPNKIWIAKHGEIQKVLDAAMRMYSP